MARIEFRAAVPGDAAEIAAFNERMAAAGEVHRLAPLAAAGDAALTGGQWSFDTVRLHEGAPITLTRYLCLSDGVVRGGVAVKTLPFQIGGTTADVTFYGYPLSEGIINPDWGMVGLMLHKGVLRQYPLVYGLGAGSADAPVARLMTGTGWSCTPVPFHFLPLRVGPFLRNLAYLRTSRARRIALDVLAGVVSLAAALTGGAALRAALAAYRLLSRGRGGQLPLSSDERTAARLPAGWRCERFEEWGPWADDLWRAARDVYTLIGDRSAAVLSALFPAGHPMMHRLRLLDATGTPRGWVVYSAARVHGHKQFGDMRLGVLIDMLARPEDALVTVGAALTAVEQAGADVVVVNHSSEAWNAAFRRAGMLPGPTNSYLFLAPGLRKRLRALQEGASLPTGASPLEGSVTPGGSVAPEVGLDEETMSSTFYFTRGDGDGPVHLW